MFNIKTENSEVKEEKLLNKLEAELNIDEVDDDFQRKRKPAAKQALVFDYNCSNENSNPNVQTGKISNRWSTKNLFKKNEKVGSIIDQQKCELADKRRWEDNEKSERSQTNKSIRKEKYAETFKILLDKLHRLSQHLKDDKDLDRVTSNQTFEDENGQKYRCNVTIKRSKEKSKDETKLIQSQKEPIIYPTEKIPLPYYYPPRLTSEIIDKKTESKRQRLKKAKTMDEVEQIMDEISSFHYQKL